MADDLSAKGPTASFRTEAGDRLVVHASGELDAESGSQLRSILSDAFASRPEAVVVDLAALRFIDSVGLSVLVSAHQRGEADGIPLEIHSVPQSCRRVFEITRLDEVLDLR
jgi:anti-sigma B factor antagonist